MAHQKKILLVILAALFLLGGCTQIKTWIPWGTKTPVTGNTPEALYRQGVEEYKAGNYKRSMDIFQTVKEQYPLNPTALLAEIGIADSHYSGKEYPEAVLAYSEFVNLHPTNENLPYVMYQIGMSHYKQMSTIDRDQTDAFNALKEFERLGSRFPGSRFAVMAEKMVRDCKKIIGEKELYVGEFYLKKGDYQAALRRFEGIASNYAHVGLDDQVKRFIDETKRRIAAQEAKEKGKKK